MNTTHVEERKEEGVEEREEEGRGRGSRRRGTTKATVNDKQLKIFHYYNWRCTLIFDSHADPPAAIPIPSVTPRSPSTPLPAEITLRLPYTFGSLAPAVPVPIEPSISLWLGLS